MKSICFISGSAPTFLGGVSLYQRNLIRYSKKQKLNLKFTWIYAGKENKRYTIEGIDCFEIKCPNYPILKEFYFAKKVKKFLGERTFEIINTHANWGYFLKNYKKMEGQKIIHTYHGVTYYYMKVQFAKFGILKYLFYPLLPFFYIIEKSPIKIADKIICISEKVKLELESLYSRKDNFFVIRTGVDLDYFKKLTEKNILKKLHLKKDIIYGLYSGRGGYWNKGLDRAIEVSSEIYNLKPNYRLIVIGSDKDKCTKYLTKPFVIYRGLIKMDQLPKYYSIANIFFSLSRYEGGAPTLALSEAIASKCFVVCSKDSLPEIFKNKQDCLIINKYDQSSAKQILNILENRQLINKIKKSSLDKIKKFSLQKWAKKYFDVLLK